MFPLNLSLAIKLYYITFGENWTKLGILELMSKLDQLDFTCIKNVHEKDLYVITECRCKSAMMDWKQSKLR